MSELGGQVGHCKSCGATVIWARTEAGRVMPVDYLPVAPGALAGNLVATKEGRVRYVTTTSPAPAGWPIYVSHFATCKDAKGWRKQ